MSHEEVGDRIMAHINHVIKNGASHIVVASSDTDIVACLLYHAVTWINHYKLKSLWNIRGNNTNRKVVPTHLLLEDIGQRLVLVLPAFAQFNWLRLGEQGRNKICSIEMHCLLDKWIWKLTTEWRMYLEGPNNCWLTALSPCPVLQKPLTN